MWNLVEKVIKVPQLTKLPDYMQLLAHFKCKLKNLRARKQTNITALFN